jgi:predicted peptidase
LPKPPLSETGKFIAGKIQATNVSLPYQFYIPKGYDPNRSYPLVICLHGTGKLGTDNRAQLSTSCVQQFTGLEIQQKYAPFVLAPQTSTAQGWATIPGKTEALFHPKMSPTLETLLDLVAKLRSSYSIDGNRVYGTGQSLGAIGISTVAIYRPGILAAVLPVAGYGDPVEGATLVMVPYWGFHGALDGTVPVRGHRALVDGIRTAGGTLYKYVEFPNKGHEIWDEVYNNQRAIYDWLFAQKLNR